MCEQEGGCRDFSVPVHLSGGFELGKPGELRSEVGAPHPETDGLLPSAPSRTCLPAAEGSCLVPRRNEGVRTVEGGGGASCPLRGLG